VYRIDTLINIFVHIAFGLAPNNYHNKNQINIKTLTQSMTIIEILFLGIELHFTKYPYALLYGRMR
jgi:hypothetical protein